MRDVPNFSYTFRIYKFASFCQLSLLSSASVGLYRSTRKLPRDLEVMEGFERFEAASMLKLVPLVNRLEFLTNRHFGAGDAVRSPSPRRHRIAPETARVVFPANLLERRGERRWNET